MRRELLKSRARALTSLVLALTMLGACGGSKQKVKAPSGEGEPAWKDKTREQRMDFMGLEVFPKMRTLFAEHDPDDAAGFACQTCHGNDMEMVDFKMPNSLFALSKTDTLEKARDYDAKVTEFMAEKVLPEMAQLLDQEPYDPATQTGFGCFGCHPSED
jgi:cytochrome c553